MSPLSSAWHFQAEWNILNILEDSNCCYSGDATNDRKSDAIRIVQRRSRGRSIKQSG